MAGTDFASSPSATAATNVLAALRAMGYQIWALNGRIRLRFGGEGEPDPERLLPLLTVLRADLPSALRRLASDESGEGDGVRCSARPTARHFETHDSDPPPSGDGASDGVRCSVAAACGGTDAVSPHHTTEQLPDPLETTSEHGACVTSPDTLQRCNALGTEGDLPGTNRTREVRCRERCSPPATATLSDPLFGSNRAAGVFWAARDAAPGTGLCEDPAHPVYARPARRWVDGVLRDVDVDACAVCWPRE
jgi:hypothetical protein